MRRDPGCRVAVTGCYAQVAPEQGGSDPGGGAGAGQPRTSPGWRALDGLGRDTTGGRRASERRPPAPRESRHCVAVTPYEWRPRAAFEGDFFTHFSGYTRAFLKVQNGCDASCSYCVIPAARGPSRSMPAGEVLAQIRLLADQGYREVVLTGIHVGSWGRDTGEGGLADLLRAPGRPTAPLPASG